MMNLGSRQESNALLKLNQLKPNVVTSKAENN